MATITVTTPPPVTVALQTLGKGEFFWLADVAYVVLSLPVSGLMGVSRLDTGAVSSVSASTQVQALTLVSAELAV